MAGTTVDDVIDGSPLVLTSYDEAFRKFGVEVPMEVLNEQRGKDKRMVIERFGGEMADDIYSHFVDLLLKNTGRVREIDGARDTFRFLRDSGIKVALNTGFPLEVAKGITDHLGFVGSGLIDSWICSEMVGKSRPDPAMIHALMEELKVRDPESVMKIDDTAKGIEEGLRAGVITLGVLTGTQSRERLQQADPHDIIPSVKALPSYLENKGYL
ncbi:MAG: HAD-IA family hydrolase [Candidatus Bathyarchaeota archaeon]|jgi:phosphonatase-like hydrolase